MAIETPFLEPFLASEAGLAGYVFQAGGGGGAAAAVGPMGPRQVRAADLLAKMCVVKGRWEKHRGEDASRTDGEVAIDPSAEC